MIDTVTDKALNAAELTEERVKREIARVAFTDCEIDTAAKMKGLDLASKVLGMQVQKVETVDLTEQSATIAAIEASIARIAADTGQAESDIAVSLYNSPALVPDSPARDLTHWGKYADVIRADQRERAAQAVEPTELDGSM